jgi:hypothetical protein
MLRTIRHKVFALHATMPRAAHYPEEKKAYGVVMISANTKNIFYGAKYNYQSN